MDPPPNAEGFGMISPAMIRWGIGRVLTNADSRIGGR
jgi:hypothetical protein